MNKKHLVLLLVCSAASVGIGYVVHAEGAPTTQPLFYSGILEDDGVLAEGDYTIRLSLYDAVTAGNLLCMSETAAVPVSVGRFRMDVSDCSDELQLEPDAWSSVTFTGSDGTPHTIPGRTKLGAVPYAMEAQHAVNASNAANAATAATLGTLAPGDVQERVDPAGCAANSSIRVVNADGSVVCEADTDTTYSATVGAGLTLTGTAFSADTSYLQRRVAAAGCAAGSSIRVVNQDGSVVCEADDNTTYAASNGIVLSGGTTFVIGTPVEYGTTTVSGTFTSPVKAFCALSQVYVYSDAEGHNPDCRVVRNANSTWTITAINQSATYGYVECKMYCF